MSETTTTAPKPVSEKQLRANRLNCLKSTGPSIEGRKRSCRNNLIHGMRSSQMILPGESPEELAELREEIHDAVQPRDGVEKLLAERVVRHAWFVRRGEGVRDDRATEKIYDTVERAADDEARAVEVLAARLEEGPEALRQLRTFPSGVAYLQDQWSIIQESLSQRLPLLASQRQRCLSLVGKKREDVLRGDRLATRWLRAQISAMYGQEATLEDVVSLLGTRPPEWMQEAEFVTRARRLKGALVPKSEALELLKAYVAEVIEELKGHREYVEDVADRNLDLDVRQARVDLTPDGNRLTNYILGSDRGCLAALRRLEIRQKPDRPAPKRRSRKPEAEAAAIPQAEPEPEPKPQDDPGSSTAQAGADISTVEAISEPAAAEPGADLLTVEAISEPATAEPGADLLTVEAISEPARAEPGADFLTVEAISEPAPAEPGADLLTVEAICEPATAEPGADLLTVEAISNDPAAEDDLERFGPEADRLRQVRLDLEAIYGAGRPIHGAIPDTGDDARPATDPSHVPTESPRLRAVQEFTRRQLELSRALDAHFGINGDRPDLAGPAPVSDATAVCGSTPKRGDSSWPQATCPKPGQT